jgi:hypothetical protein
VARETPDAARQKKAPGAAWRRRAPDAAATTTAQVWGARLLIQAELLRTGV